MYHERHFAHFIIKERSFWSVTYSLGFIDYLWSRKRLSGVTKQTSDKSYLYDRFRKTLIFLQLFIDRAQHSIYTSSVGNCSFVLSNVDDIRIVFCAE